MRIEKYSYRKSEDFYVIKDNGDSVTVLERYNLMVGNKVEAKSDFSDIESEAELTSSDKDYALQSNLTKFEVADEGISKSTNLYVFIAFANENEDNKDSNDNYLGYWTNIENKELDKPLSKYGEIYQ